jgi:hypothetical protein
MSRRDWSPLRLVAENIGAGDRSYSNMRKIPELSFEQGPEAISQLVQIGMVTVTGDRVEPTAAFGSWLADLRQQENALIARGSVKQPVAVSQQGPQGNPAKSTHDYDRENRPVAGQKRNLSRREFSHLSPVGQLAAQIIDRLDCLGSQTTKRTLERSMSAHKLPLWQQAWKMLLAWKCIQLTAGGRRQQIVTLVDLPAWAEPKTAVKKRRRKRPPTEWFKQRLPEFLERDGYAEKTVSAAEEVEYGGPRLYVPGDPLAR